MKRTILLICICLMTLGLWGCSSAPAQQEPAVGSDTITESINKGTNSTDQNNQDVAKTTPDGVKDGDELEGGSFYFDDVTINSYDDAVTFLKKYNLYKDGESYFINFDTPEYYGLIIYTLEEDHFKIIKDGENFYQEYTYSREGLADSYCWETGNDVDETKAPVVLEHGVKIDDSTVYIDTAITEIHGRQDINFFFDLIDEYFGEYNPDITYEFVTDTGRVNVSKRDYGYYVYEYWSEDISVAYIQRDIDYDENKTLIKQYTVAREENGEKYSVLEKDGNTEKTEWLNDGTVVSTKVKNGATSIEKRKDSKCIYYYKSNFIESFLTYNDNGALVGYKAISLKDGEVCDWVLDGNGLEADNFVSVTITRNGSSHTYVGKDQIPWGAAIFYPPRTLGSYQ